MEMIDRRALLTGISTLVGSVPFISSLGKAQYIPTITIETSEDIISRNVKMVANEWPEFDVVKLNRLIMKHTPQTFPIKRVMRGPIDELMEGKVVIARARKFDSWWSSEMDEALKWAGLNDKERIEESLELIASDLAYELIKERERLEKNYHFIAPYQPAIPVKYIDRTRFYPYIGFVSRYGIIREDWSDVNSIRS